jgi:glycosyltransferase involved in cell wall biosynthesis
VKVLHVIPSVALTEGGPSRAISDIERALAGCGVEVTTIATDDDGNGGHVPCVRYGEPVATAHATRLYFRKTTEFYKVSIGLYRWLRHNVEDYDLVHAHALFSFAPVAAASCAHKAGVPYVLRPLGVLARYGMTEHRPLLKRMSLSVIEKRLLESANAIHFTGETEKQEAEALGLKLRSVVIPLGLETPTESFRTRVDAATPTDTNALSLLFLSRIHPKKNVECLLRGFALIAASYPQLSLDIGGTGDKAYMDYLAGLIEQLGLKERVNWLGFLQGADKIRAFRRATVFVLPSFSENFGLAAAEALMQELPCVVGRGVAISREIEAAGAGVAVDPTPENIAVAVDGLLGNAEKRASMRVAAGRLARERYSIEAMGSALRSLYCELV